MTNTTEATKWYTKAFNSFTKAAEQGNASAQYKLGGTYRYGLGVGENASEAANWYKKAAEHDHAMAQNSLGSMYKRGEGVTKDADEAVKWFMRESEQEGYLNGNGCHMSTEDREALQEDTKELLFKFFMRWAKRGDASAHTASAQYEVAEAYKSGFGVVRDKQEAFNWYLKAANTGEEWAQYEVGAFYAEDTSTAENRIEAYRWLSLAAPKLELLASSERNRIASTMTAKEVAEAQQRIRAFSVGQAASTK